MKQLIPFLLLFQLAFNSSTGQMIHYPETPKKPVIDSIFGKVIADDYRWIEDINHQQVKDWLKKQATLTDDIIDNIPGRNKLIEEFRKTEQLASSEISLFIIREAGRYFYKMTRAGENIPSLYYRQGKTGKEILLFNPGSDSVSFNFLPSKDGKKVALSLTSKGNFDITTTRVLDVDTRKFYPDSIYPVGSIQAWSPDSKGFVYAELQTSDKHSNNLWKDVILRYHRLNSDARNDKAIFSRIHNPELDLKPSDFLNVYYSPDNNYLIAVAYPGAQAQNRYFYSPAGNLEKEHVRWRVLTTIEDQVSEAIIYKDKAYLVTRKNAPNFKVLEMPLDTPDLAHTTTLVPETDIPIGWIRVSKDYLFIQKTQGIVTKWTQYNFSTGKSEEVKFPHPGSVWIYCLDASTNECLVNLLSYTKPLTRYDYNPKSQQVSLSAFNVTCKYPGVNDLVTEQVDVKSYDGTMVPLSLIYNKYIKKDGSHIAFMTGYGAYGNVSIQYFDPLSLSLLNRGVVIAITHPRGGGEKGFAWHMGGYKSTKPNTWKDFIACGEYLITHRYTSPRHLIGEGTSAGGILIGRAITERPDLFAAAINNVPVSNPLRGENRPNGEIDAKEFGTVKDSTEAMGLIEMDPFLHVTPGVNYPAVIAIAGINDTRVPVWQPAKFVAALQNASTSNKPVLLQLNYDSGHGAEEKKVRYRILANMYAFALWQAGHNDFKVVQTK
ncbi:prolyl oligopeptidase family serine peptidase [Flavihumibacter fluvii]|uniref:prolyl oligopeptidase family serine peptidase n=1 Tax=Flavihumibacter fluvii TaxID=2838157 RepID=UPI001BDF5823|nr:prolyl oligopeptidase family serine peptidase [Flavihumibacter fluvii]ULQ53385.1 prolyl oligopeptidase family serine peptidase [Flavihumibacter fluvii]